MPVLYHFAIHSPIPVEPEGEWGVGDLDHSGGGRRQGLQRPETISWLEFRHSSSFIFIHLDIKLFLFVFFFCLSTLWYLHAVAFFVVCSISIFSNYM